MHLGDARGMPTLIESLMASENGARFMSFETLKHYTHEDIQFDPEAPLAARQEAYLKWRRWWRGQSENFKVNVRAAQIDAEIRM